MIEIRELAPGQLAEAADFAAQQFGCDISAAQPKLYGPRAAGSTYGAFIQGKMAGMLSVYGMTYRSLRWLSVGSVCCAPLYRGRGVMRALFSFLEREVYPQYDAVSLLGQRRLYERFGFAKVYPFLEYAFCFPAQQTECGVERLDRGCRDNDLFTLYQQYGKGPSRSPALFFETAATNGHAVYWLEEHGRAAYAACREDHHRITELCGTMPVEDACRLMAACWGRPRCSIRPPSMCWIQCCAANAIAMRCLPVEIFGCCAPNGYWLLWPCRACRRERRLFWQRGKGSIYRCESARCMCAGVFRRGCRFIRTTSWFTPCLA